MPYFERTRKLVKSFYALSSILVILTIIFFFTNPLMFLICLILTAFFFTLATVVNVIAKDAYEEIDFLHKQLSERSADRDDFVL